MQYHEIGKTGMKDRLSASELPLWEEFSMI